MRSKSIHIVLRAAPSFWSSLDTAVAETGDPTILICQGQAKTYTGNGATNPSLFAQQDWDDHPGPAPTPGTKQAIETALRDPAYTVHVYNSFAGEHANDRARAAEFILAHLNFAYKQQGGVSTIVYHMVHDVDGRNDKVHLVQAIDENHEMSVVSENNAPGGVYAPLIYRSLGVDSITVFDSHSKNHISNLENAFGKNVSILSSLEPVADRIIEKHRSSILEGRLRLGAPDGWDKRDDPDRNLAIVRIQTIAGYIWDKMPELKDMHNSPEEFLGYIQFGVVKVHESEYPGAPAKPKVKSVHGEVSGCDCELVDDVVDSGGSLTQSAEALLSKGANRVDASVCHGPAQESSLHYLLNATCVIDGQTRVTIDNFTTSNMMARVEGFIESLSKEQQRRTHLINSGAAMVSHLMEFSPEPLEPRLPLSAKIWQPPRFLNGG